MSRNDPAIRVSRVRLNRVSGLADAGQSPWAATILEKCSPTVSSSRSGCNTLAGDPKMSFDCNELREVLRREPESTGFCAHRSEYLYVGSEIEAIWGQTAGKPASLLHGRVSRLVIN